MEGVRHTSGSRRPWSSHSPSRPGFGIHFGSAAGVVYQNLACHQIPSFVWSLVCVVKFKTCGKFLDLIWYAHQFGKVRVLVFWKQIWYVEQKEKTRFICHSRRVPKFCFAWQISNKKRNSEVSLIISGFAVGQPTSPGFPLCSAHQIRFAFQNRFGMNPWRLGTCIKKFCDAHQFRFAYQMCNLGFGTRI